MLNTILDYRLPHPSLREFVRLFQIVGCTFPPSMHNLPMKPYWPRAENSLAFFPHDREQLQYGRDGEKLIRPASVINGQYAVVTNRYVGRNFMVFQVQFQPGALYRLAGIPVSALTNSFVDAELLFSTEIKLLNERLANVGHYEEMIPLVEAFLRQLVDKARKRPERAIDKASRFLLDHPETNHLDWLADQSCLSQRQFYRLFVERSGISPKFYSRIARFESVIRVRIRRPELDWLSIAVQAGYHDYQHMVRDFKAFTSMTPNEFMLQESNAPERTFGKAEFEK